MVVVIVQQESHEICREKKEENATKRKGRTRDEKSLRGGRKPRGDARTGYGYCGGSVPPNPTDGRMPRGRNVTQLTSHETPRLSKGE